MNVQAVIDAYVADVVRRLPSKDRQGIGVELRGLLMEMLSDRADAAGRAPDDAMVLAMLREFGAPAEVAHRYRPPSQVLIPAEHTRSFAAVALIGVGLQWALTLPSAISGETPIAAWWLTSGLGALWWPGFMVVCEMIGAALRALGWLQPKWKPRNVDPERVHRGLLGFALVCFAAAIVGMACLPWIIDQLPGPAARALAMDPAFLHQRAWMALPLWLGSFAVLALVLRNGRWTPTLRKWEAAGSVAFMVMMLWWILAGPIMQTPAADRSAKAILWMIIAWQLIDFAVKAVRARKTQPQHVALR